MSIAAYVMLLGFRCLVDMKTKERDLAIQQFYSDAAGMLCLLEESSVEYIVH